MTDTLNPAGVGAVAVFVLEFAGDDDAYSAAEAAAAAATGLEVIAPGLATARTVDVERARGLAFTRRVSGLLGRTGATIGAARDLLEAAAIDTDGSAAVRARDVRGTAGIDTRTAERELGAALVDRGFGIDLEGPDVEVRALFADGVCVLGRLLAESHRDFGERVPSRRPFFQPGSMDPLEARAVVNLARAAPGRHLIDPMCGTAGLLVEAGLLGAAVTGVDVQAKMVRGSRQNLNRYLEGPFDLLMGEAGRLPFVDASFDAAVFDVPYGRQSPVTGRDATSLLRRALDEAARLADRAVVVADRSVADLARATGWAPGAEHERPVHRSLTRHVHVLESA